VLRAKALAQKKTAAKKGHKVVRHAKKSKTKKNPKLTRGNRASRSKISPRRTKPRGTRKSPPAGYPVKKESTTMEADYRKSAAKTGVTSAIDASPRLLRQTKTTSAALALLEKGIEYIFKKDFKKARTELNTLLESYPSETEILARARSYIQICDREEGLQKKAPVSTDQLYALGVLEHNKANYDLAISYFLESLRNHPRADYIYYSAAASMAMKGDLVNSLENLRKAIELNEDSRIYAKNDSDFAALQTTKEFAELVGINPALSSEPQQ
jgi:tetratricopeptide (TPR) repeat protein